MPNEELWPLNLGIDERRDESSAIRNGKLRARSRRAHVVASRIVADPSEDAWDCGVEASRHKERHSVLDPVGIDVGNHCIANDGERQRCEHDRATHAEMVGEECYADLER